MKTNFIKTTEKGANFSEVFGEELLDATVAKFKDCLDSNKNVKKTVYNISGNISKEELVIMNMLAITKLSGMKGLALMLLSNKESEGDFNLDINPKEENLLQALGENNAVISVKKFMKISQGENSDSLGVVFQELLDGMTREELTVSLLLIA